MRTDHPVLELARGFLDLAFPAACLLCDEPLDRGPGRALCRRCWRNLPLVRGRACDRCGARDPLDIWQGGCSSCRRKRFPHRSLVAGGDYQGGLRDLVHLLKFEGFEAAARPLGTLLARRLRVQRTVETHRPELVVAVPTTAGRRMARGFNPAERIGRIVARELEIPFDRRALRRTRSSPPQTGLSGPERRRNVLGVFAAGPEVAGKVVLLVDDVRTTGATLSEAARALRRAGARSVVAAVVATSGRA